MLPLLWVLVALFCGLECDANTARGPGCSPSVRQGYANQWPKGLDYGIYWLGPNHTFEKATPHESRNYNPKKPTSIFFHGWQGAFGGTTKTCFRMGTACKSCIEHVEIMDAWFKKGWNVGMFYWDQFADERCVRDVEYKIWNVGKQPLRWLSNDCEGYQFEGTERYHNYDGKETSVSDICASSMRYALRDFEGPEVRFIGESLGTQLVSGCAELLHYNKDHMAPNRVVLLEPAFSHTGLAGRAQCRELPENKNFGEEAEKHTNAALRKLKEYGVPIELYTSSPLVWKYVLCANPEVEFDVHVHYEPLWCNHPHIRFLEQDFQNNIACYHDSVVAIYYLTMGIPPYSPQTAGLALPLSDECKASKVPSASSSLDDIRQVSQKCKHGGRSPHFEQSQGLSTLSVLDDGFRFRDDTPLISVEAVQSKMSVQATESAAAHFVHGNRGRPTWIYPLSAGFGVVLLLACFAARWRRVLSDAESSGQDSELLEGNDGDVE